MKAEYIAVILAIVALVAFSGCIGSGDAQGNNTNGYTDTQAANDGANPNPAEFPPQGIMHNRTGNWTGMPNETMNRTRNGTGMRNWNGNRNQTRNWTSGERPPGNWTKPSLN